MFSFHFFNKILIQKKKILVRKKKWSPYSNSIHTAGIPIFALMAEQVPTWVKKEINTIARKFFWTGSNNSTNGKAAVVWHYICQPKSSSGLGVKNFSIAAIVPWHFKHVGYGCNTLIRPEYGQAYLSKCQTWSRHSLKLPFCDCG